MTDRIDYTADDLVLCESPDGWSLHAPGSTDEQIAAGDAPYILSGSGTPGAADYTDAFRRWQRAETRYEITPMGGSTWAVKLDQPGERPEHLCSVESGDGENYDEDDILAAAMDICRRIGSRGVEDDGLPVYVDGLRVR